MDTIMKIKSKNMADVLESCIDTLKDGFQKTLGRTMKWTLHATEQDAISEMGRAELVFLMLVNALAHLDTEMSGMMLREADRWTIFPRITKYMAGKMDAEWEVPREILDRASNFAKVLELSGLFSVPRELCSYLDQLLAEEEDICAGAENNSLEGAASGSGEAFLTYEQSKRPRKDPRGSLSQLGAEASGGECHQERHYRLTARRRRSSRKQGGREEEKMGKHAPSHQQVPTSPPLDVVRSASQPTTVSSKKQTSACYQLTSKPTGSIPKVRLLKSIGLQTVHSPPTGAIPKLRKGESTRSPAAAGREAAASSRRARQVNSTGCQTEETPTSGTIEVSCAASQTAPLPRVTKKEAQKQMWEGVREDNGQLIEGAVLSGADLEEEGVDKMTPLTLAAAEGQVEAVRALIRLGSRLERRDGGWQGSSLYWASRRGQEEVVRELLAAGASVGAENMNRATPLHTASQWGHQNIAKLLVEAGAIIGAEDNDRETPLHYASAYGQLAIARLLVEAGADLNPRNNKGETPLAQAEIARKHAVAKYLPSVGATR